MERIGITEAGDASIDFSWVKRLDKVKMAIIISKGINERFITELINNKDKIIFHCTVTGYGSTIMEEKVCSEFIMYNNLKLLIERGFPVEHIVLRVDPIIPDCNGIEIALGVMNKFKDLGITRCRYSFLDMYRHVKDRFIANGLKLPYKTFNAPLYMQSNFIEDLGDSGLNDVYTFESCAENTSDKVGCVSSKDVNILGMNIVLDGSSRQRENCNCCNNKLELLTGRVRCDNSCLYCYWKDKII